MRTAPSLLSKYKRAYSWRQFKRTTMGESALPWREWWLSALRLLASSCILRGVFCTQWCGFCPPFCTGCFPSLTLCFVVVINMNARYLDSFRARACVSKILSLWRLTSKSIDITFTASCMCQPIISSYPMLPPVLRDMDSFTVSQILSTVFCKPSLYPPRCTSRVYCHNATSILWAFNFDVCFIWLGAICFQSRLLQLFGFALALVLYVMLWVLLLYKVQSHIKTGLRLTGMRWM